MNDDHIAVKKLAAEVMRAAANDFKRAVNAGDYTAYAECRRFLTNSSIWHELLDLSPDYTARWVNRHPQVRRVRAKRNAPVETVG